MTYGGCEIMNLMVMAYDRYISICFPLHYEKIIGQAKALSTCIPHLVAIVNFFIGCSFEVYQTSSLSAGFHFSKFRATWILLQRLLEFRAQDPMS
ncbi:putative olfactory receptor 4A4 [Clupea harengus]|uniref:Olfactory receptor 4A4 n=1 Tax=Clupea harengus TaxID=7950 RepID=A0A6P8FK96_CLUHA|nr:putative olfactory receptor 4A4 [Clupea harengus]